MSEADLIQQSAPVSPREGGLRSSADSGSNALRVSAERSGARRGGVVNLSVSDMHEPAGTCKEPGPLPTIPGAVHRPFQIQETFMIPLRLLGSLPALCLVSGLAVA